MKRRFLKILGVFIIIAACSTIVPSEVRSQPFLSLHLDTQGDQTFCPYPFEPFNAYLVLQNADYYVTAVEYRLAAPDGNFIVLDYSFPPEHSVDFGHPFTGQSISYWPPLNGFGGDLVLCTMECVTLIACPDMPDYRLDITTHPDSGFLRGTFSPDNEFFDIIGGSSYLCYYSGNPPYIYNAGAESDEILWAAFLKEVDNWYEEYPGGSYVLDNTVAGDTIHVVEALPVEDNKQVFHLYLGTPLASGHYYTLYVTNACTNGACEECAMDTRWDFYYEGPISKESSSWGRVKSLKTD